MKCDYFYLKNPISKKNKENKKKREPRYLDTKKSPYILNPTLVF